jgi:hypothetical protein
METSHETERAPNTPGIGRDAAALGVSRFWLWRVLSGRSSSPELKARYDALKANEAAAISRLAKVESLEILDRLRHLEFLVASGNIAQRHHPRLALLIWEIEKLALPFPAEPTAPPDPEAEALRALCERQQAEMDAKVEAAIETLRERLAAGPAAKPLSAATPTQTIREPGQVAGRSAPLASDCGT